MKISECENLLSVKMTLKNQIRILYYPELMGMCFKKYHEIVIENSMRFFNYKKKNNCC
ncbi:hypothetical protein FLAT13_00162 [Flavobacterium salmonis]|uniref:Uncharacterized protein n=1 Tax=Flavobacterium salmonis TaxID=2654844 RepID=A0A6V6YMY0_9FLAO|nr:hypothetical protein FLAT13_00162 [Flavobacterium salmonis]